MTSYSASAEHGQRLADQLGLRLEELEADGSEGEIVAKLATPATDRIASFERKRQGRKPFPAHLPRERIVHIRPVAVRGYPD